jgi:hypothetical protein
MSLVRDLRLEAKLTRSIATGQDFLVSEPMPYATRPRARPPVTVCRSEGNGGSFDQAEKKRRVSPINPT